MNKETLQPKKKIIGITLCFIIVANMFLGLANIIPSNIAILVILVVRLLALFM